MTDTSRHDKPADRRSRSQALSRQVQQIRDGQGSLLLFSQFPEPPEKDYPPGDPLSWPGLKPNQRGCFLGRAKS